MKKKSVNNNIFIKRHRIAGVSLFFHMSAYYEPHKNIKAFKKYTK